MRKRRLRWVGSTMQNSVNGSKKGGANNREKILSAAEILFAEHGYKGCTFRIISDATGINQSLLHYYFSTKQNLFSETFQSRAQELVSHRAELLDHAEAEGGDAPVPVERLVRCFIEPPLRMLQGNAGQRSFIRIHAQLRSDPIAFSLELRRQTFGPSTSRFVNTMARACPHLSWDAVAWRFNFMIGSYLVVVTQGGRIEDISGGQCDSKDIDTAIAHLVPSIVASFQAPDKKTNGALAVTDDGAVGRKGVRKS